LEDTKFNKYIKKITGDTNTACVNDYLANVYENNLENMRMNT